jgi:hypothetical protein
MTIIYPPSICLLLYFPRNELLASCTYRDYTYIIEETTCIINNRIFVGICVESGSEIENLFVQENFRV